MFFVPGGRANHCEDARIPLVNLMQGIKSHSAKTKKARGFVFLGDVASNNEELAAHEHFTDRKNAVRMPNAESAYFTRCGKKSQPDFGRVES